MFLHGEELCLQIPILQRWAWWLFTPSFLIKCKFRESLNLVAKFLQALAFWLKHLLWKTNGLQRASCIKVKVKGGEQTSGRVQNKTKQYCLKHVLIKRDQRIWCQFIEKQVRQAQVTSGSRMLIIHKKSGIRLPCYSWKSGGQNLRSNSANVIEQLCSSRRSLLLLEMEENESSLPNASQQGKSMQALKYFAAKKFGALLVSTCRSLFRFQLLQHVLHIYTSGLSFCACVYLWKKKKVCIPCLCNAVVFENKAQQAQ